MGASGLRSPISLGSREARGKLTVACALARCSWEGVGGEAGGVPVEEPEGTVLYEAVRDHLVTLLAEAREVGATCPGT